MAQTTYTRVILTDWSRRCCVLFRCGTERYDTADSSTTHRTVVTVRSPPTTMTTATTATRGGRHPKRSGTYRPTYLCGYTAECIGPVQSSRVRSSPVPRVDATAIAVTEITRTNVLYMMWIEATSATYQKAGGRTAGREGPSPSASRRCDQSIECVRPSILAIHRSVVPCFGAYRSRSTLHELAAVGGVICAVCLPYTQVCCADPAYIELNHRLDYLNTFFAVHAGVIRAI